MTPDGMDAQGQYQSEAIKLYEEHMSKEILVGVILSCGKCRWVRNGDQHMKTYNVAFTIAFEVPKCTDLKARMLRLASLNKQYY